MSPARGESGSQPWKGPPRPPQPRASPETRTLPQPASPRLFYLRICCQNSNELSILWPRQFSHRGLVAGWLRVQSQQWEEKTRAKEFFSTFFFFRFHSFLSLPAPSLLALLYPFLLQDRSNWSPGGSYRECIGSLGEKSPNKLYTRCIMLYGQTGKHKSRKTKGVN